MNIKRHSRGSALALAASLIVLAAGRSTAPIGTGAFVRSGDPVATAFAPTDSMVAAFAERYGISRHLAGVIHGYSVSLEVEPAIVFGLIATESNFDPQAVGRGGAIGLMQIKPSTARIYDRRVTRRQLFLPEVNVRLGLRHLKQEVEYFGDDWTLGLLAYNMGRTRLSRALEHGRVPRTGYAARILARCEDLCS